MKLLLLAIAISVIVPFRASAQTSDAPPLRYPQPAVEQVIITIKPDQDTRWRLNDCLMRRRDFEVRGVETIKLSKADSCEVPKKLRATASPADLDLIVAIMSPSRIIAVTVTLNRGGPGADESYKDVLWCLCADAKDVFLSARRNGLGAPRSDPDYCQVILKGGSP